MQTIRWAKVGALDRRQRSRIIGQSPPTQSSSLPGICHPSQPLLRPHFSPCSNQGLSFHPESVPVDWMASTGHGWWARESKSPGWFRNAWIRWNRRDSCVFHKYLLRRNWVAGPLLRESTIQSNSLFMSEVQTVSLNFFLVREIDRVSCKMNEIMGFIGLYVGLYRHSDISVNGPVSNGISSYTLL